MLVRDWHKGHFELVGRVTQIGLGFYLLSVIPLFGLTLFDLNLLGRNRKPHDKMAIHAVLVAAFLIVGHVAMIFGMMDPAVLGYAAGPHGH